MGCNTLNSICEQSNVSKIKHLTYKSHEKHLIEKEQVVSWNDGKNIIPYFFFSSHINIWTTQSSRSNKDFIRM